MFVGLFAIAIAGSLPAQPVTVRLGPGSSEEALPTICRQHAGQIVAASVDSSVYGAPVPVSVYLPPCYDPTGPKLPVIYLLHGGSADETQWPDLAVQSNADDLIAQGQRPFIVVMPGGSYNVGLDYDTFIVSDLLPGIERQFRVKDTGAGRAIGGLSLGGYWALKIALSRPDLFAAVGGHSPVVDYGQPDDPLALARSAYGLDQLRITLDVGADDSLRQGTASLAQVLQDRGLSILFAVYPGGHARPYWRAHSGEYLQFYLQALAPQPVSHLCRASAKP